VSNVRVVRRTKGLGRFYAAALKDYTPQGYAVIDRAQFARLYKKAREGAFTVQYCQAGW